MFFQNLKTSTSFPYKQNSQHIKNRSYHNIKESGIYFDEHFSQFSYIFFLHAFVRQFTISYAQKSTIL